MRVHLITLPRAVADDCRAHRERHIGIQQIRQRLFDIRRADQVIAEHQLDVFGARLIDAGNPVAHRADVLSVAEIAHAIVTLGDLAHYTLGAVSAGVIDHHHFNVSHRLQQSRSDALLHQTLAVIGGDDYRGDRRRPGHRLNARCGRSNG